MFLISKLFHCNIIDCQQYQNVTKCKYNTIPVKTYDFFEKILVRGGNYNNPSFNLASSVIIS